MRRTLGVSGAITDSDDGGHVQRHDQTDHGRLLDTVPGDGTASFSIEAWAKHTGDGNFRQIVSA